MALFSGEIFTGDRSWRKRHGEPRNHREQFLCILFDNVTSFLPLNFLGLLFWLPAVAWGGLWLLTAATAVENGDTDVFISAMNALFLGMIPCILLGGLSRTGMSYVMRFWADEDLRRGIPTFLRGIRSNWKEGLAASFLAALIPAALWFAKRTAASSGSLLFQTLFPAFCIAAAIVLLSLQVLYPLLVTYDGESGRQIVNAIRITIAKLPSLILIRLAAWFPILLMLLFAVIRPSYRYVLLVIPVVYYLFLGVSLTDFIYASHFRYLRENYIDRKETD